MKRKWCLIVVMGTLLASPIWAQEKNDTSNGAKPAGDEASKNAPAADATSTAPISHSSLATPEAPRAMPRPAPAAAEKDDAPARIWNKYEVAITYDYVNFHPNTPFDAFNNQGAAGEFAYNAAPWLGLVLDSGIYRFRRTDLVIPAPSRADWYSFMAGPRLNLRHFDHFIPFAEFMAGAVSGGRSLTGNPGTNTSFGLLAGGGVDIVLTKYVAWRFVQLDYLMSNLSGPNLGPQSRQNSFRAATGLVIRWGFPAPPAPKGPPVATCSASPASVFAGSNDPVAVHVNASSPDSLPLTYAYVATGGTVEGTGPDARWNSSGVATGSYTVTAKVDDGKGGTASCSTDISVQEKPHHPPTISCAPDRTPIMPGERATITSTASSPDNLPLTYNYSASGGQISGTGSTATFDSTGLQPGSYTINCGVTDDRGDKAQGTTNVDVQQPPPPPQATKIGECGYTKPGVARFDNLCKRVGDDVALRLKNDPTAKVVVVGFADGKEPKSAKLAQSRADLAKAYLGEKGIDASRVSTRTGEASKEKGAEKENRRVEFIFVPEGATY